jgi:hypothetical protein
MERKSVFKTKKTISGTRCTYRAWKEWQDGEYIVGTYVGSKTDNYDKPNWMVKVIEAKFAKKKDSEALVGQTIGLNSAGGLDKAMEKLKEGDLVQVTYTGTVEMEKGKYAGKDAHTFLVEVDGGSGADEEEEENEDL